MIYRFTMQGIFQVDETIEHFEILLTTALKLSSFCASSESWLCFICEERKPKTYAFPRFCIAFQFFPKKF